MSNLEAPWRVMGTRGCGSAIVEAALVIAKIPYEREEVNYGTSEGHEKLAEVNPLAQVPTVVLPDGTIMTESAAIILYVDGLVPELGLVPAVRDPLRRELLRWLMFLVAAVYPTFTYGDDPKKWVGDAGDSLRTSTDEHRKSLWRLVGVGEVGLAVPLRAPPSGLVAAEDLGFRVRRPGHGDLLVRVEHRVQVSRAAPLRANHQEVTNHEETRSVTW